MKLHTTVLIILGVCIKWSEGYVAGVNPKLVKTGSTTSHPNVDSKTDHQNLVESKTRRNTLSTTTLNYDDSGMIHPSPSDNAFMRRYKQETNEQTRDETAIRSFQTNPVNRIRNPLEVELIRFSSGYPFERDDDDDRPIWRN